MDVRRWFGANRSFVLACLALVVVTSRIPADDLPIVPDGFQVEVIAREPMVSNPCVIAFDRQGRICIGQGPQWRAPTPETPGDRVDILIDDDGDGIADRRQTFAEGFNSIQGLAWHGDDLWIANAPDLTIARDTDGDDQADVYIRVYTGLGNLEHSLHGLNFGPDGKLYMSKGNSKGYNRPGQLAPQVFRELWGLPSPEGAPDYPPSEVFTKATYRRNYHTPNDDWGQQGGILRCDPYGGEGEYGHKLEIVSRGFRNPWDIAFDDQFNWLGTDNDQTQGDRIFAPFFGAHFGWGHAWSFHWTGEEHLPTVPNSAKLFEGSGTGVIHYHADQFPEKYRGVFFVNDWMRREIYAFRPRWDGALMHCEGDFPPTFAHAEGGRALPSSSGRVFEPTDIEVGPDGALYVLSWGHGYGGTFKGSQQVDAGRVYRIRYTGNPPGQWRKEHRSKPADQWTNEELLADLGSSIPAWRVSAQNELLRRGDAAKPFLREAIEREQHSQATLTWAMWTLGRLSPDAKLDEYFAAKAKQPSSAIQSLRILAHRVHEFAEIERLPEIARESLQADDPRIRHAAVLAIERAGESRWIDDLTVLAATESDRVVFYSTWQVLRSLADLDQRKQWLSDRRGGVRLAALLGLLEDDALTGDEILALRSDADPRVAGLASDWLEKTGNGKPLVEFAPPPGEYTTAQSVTLRTSVPGAFLTYTTDGSRPTYTSPRVGGPIPITRNTTLRVAVNTGNTGGSLYAVAEYTIRHVPPYRHREFAGNVNTPSGRPHEIDWTGLKAGKRHYTDRDYRITAVPPELAELPFIRTANNDDRSTGDKWLSFELTEPSEVLVGVDARNEAPLRWMQIGETDGFLDTGLELKTTDPTFRIYKRRFPAGRAVLGGNTNDPRTDSGRGNYVVIFNRPILESGPVESYGIDDVLPLMATADAERGRELFLHPRGAGCFKCHRMEGRGGVLAPDLADIGTRAKTPRVLIESILEPSRVITEGFAQQQILTIQGRVHSGAVIEETARSMKLATADAKVETIYKSDIEERRGTTLSPMPAGFGKLMSAQQIADITAWLLTQTVVGDRQGFSFRDRDDHLDIYLGEQRIATYLKRHSRLTRRALVNVMTPSGIQVTRNFPPRAPEDLDPGYQGENGIIHPVMHSGIWLSFGDVNGNDYWRLRAKVKFDGFIAEPKGAKSNGSFTARNLLMSQDGEHVVCREITRYRFKRVPAGWLLQLDAEYQPVGRDFYFGDQEESGLAVRVASPLRVQGGNGTILNDLGERNGSQVWGKPAQWFDYFGTIEGREVGIMVMPDPGNFRPSWLHARDYGVVVTNPFPKQPRERREPYVKTWVKQGETLRLRYAVLIHDLPARGPLNHPEVYQDVIESFSK